MENETVTIVAVVITLFACWIASKLRQVDRLPAPDVQQIWGGQCICGSHLSGTGYALGVRLAAWKQKMQKVRRSHRLHWLYQNVTSIRSKIGNLSTAATADLEEARHRIDLFSDKLRSIREARLEKYLHCQFCDAVHKRAKFPWSQNVEAICDSGATWFGHESWVDNIAPFAQGVHLALHRGEEE